MKLTGKEKVSYGLGAVGKDMVYMFSGKLCFILLSGYFRSQRDRNGNHFDGGACV